MDGDCDVVKSMKSRRSLNIGSDVHLLYSDRQDRVFEQALFGAQRYDWPNVTDHRWLFYLEDIGRDLQSFLLSLSDFDGIDAPLVNLTNGAHFD